MGNQPSSIFMNQESDSSIIKSWKNILDLFYQKDEYFENSVINLLCAVGINDYNLVRQHLEQDVFRISSPTDFVTQKVIHLMSQTSTYVPIMSLKPWSYYKIRNSKRTSEFVLSDDMLEDVASNENHSFWILLSLTNNIPYVNGSNLVFKSNTEFWVKLCILLGNIDLASDICIYNKIDFFLFNNFTMKYRPQNIESE